VVAELAVVVDLVAELAAAVDRQASMVLVAMLVLRVEQAVLVEWAVV
jgi:hypothetical protein